MPSTLVSFSKGTKANLNPSTIGGLYLTTDTGELFLHNAVNDDIKISDIETVAEESDLPAVGTEIATKFYYVEETNGLYRVVDNEWTKLGGDPVSAGTGLTYAADGITLKTKIKSETGIGTSEDAAETATSGRFYPVQVDNSGNLAVNVPWTDSGSSVQSVNGQTGVVVLDADDVGAIDTSLKGANSGVAELDSTGKVPTTQLPSYVDDVEEYADYAALPSTGESGKIYITLDDNKTYRWSGSIYVVIGSSLALGETDSTAYRGDRGAAAYAHSQNIGATTTYTNNLYKVTINSEGHVTAATAVQKSDITDLGIPGSDTTYESKEASQSGTDVSLVTTGEKYIWNNKTDNTGTVTQVSTGAGLTGGDITTSGTIKAKLKSERLLGESVASATSSTTNRFYPVQLDNLGNLAVDVPWTDTQPITPPVTSVNTKTGDVVLDASDVGAIDTSLKGANSGVAELDSTGKVPTTQMPTYVSSVNNASGAVTLDASSVGAIDATEKGANSGVAELDSTGKVPTTQMPTYVSSVNGNSGAVTLGASDVGAIDASLKGANSGVAELDSNGKVPASQLPSYVDDVEEYTSINDFPVTGETGKIYIALDTNITYRWGGSIYVVIGSSLALGETDSTAYRGDRGAAAYAHAVTNKGSAFTSGLYKITTNSEGHVTAATAVQKSDITDLGVPSSDTTYTPGTGLTIPTGTTTINHSNSVTAGSTSSSSGQLVNGGTLNLPKVTYDAQGHITSVDTTECILPSISSGVTSITAGDGLSGGTITTTGTISLPTVGTGSGTSGSTTAQAPAFGDTFNVPYVTTDVYGRVSARGTATVTIPNTIATQSTDGLMSAADKTTLDNIGALQGMTSDPTSVSTALASTAYLCNYLAAEKMVISIATSDWSSTTVTIDSKAYYYYYLSVTSILVSHPIMFLATDSIPTDAQESAWGELKMVADTTNSRLCFYSTSVPTIAIPVGIKGIVP